MTRPTTLLLIPLALLLPAACGDDREQASSSSSSTATEADEEDGTSSEDDAAPDGSGTPLEPEEARREGNPEVFAGIASETDCTALEQQLETHRTNAETRRADGNERRASILDEYAAATEARMDELSCAAT